MDEFTKINKKVAEVLGWKEVHVSDMPDLIYCGNLVGTRYNVKLGWETTEVIPNFAGDMSSAWLILEKVRNVSLSKSARFFELLEEHAIYKGKYKLDPVQWIILYMEPKDLCGIFLQWEKESNLC